MPSLDQQALQRLTDIPYFYLETQGSASQSIVVLCAMIVCFLNIFSFKALLTFKRTIRPKKHLEISLGRMYQLILPVLFGYFISNVFCCVLAIAVALGSVFCCVFAYKERFDQQSFDLTWMCLRGLTMGFWFGICITVFFKFT